MQRARATIAFTLLAALLAFNSACGKPGETEREFVHVESENGAVSEKAADADAPAEDAAAERANDGEIEGCVGLSALEALAIAEDLGYVADFTDSDGRGVTDVVKAAKDGSPAASATVTEARTSTVLFTKVANFTIDYSDEGWLESLVDRPAFDVCTEIEGMSSERYSVEGYPSVAYEEAPTLDDMRGTDLVVMGARRGLTALKLQVVSSTYRDMEVALSERLSSDAAADAAEFYAYDQYELSAWTDCAVAVDDSTWKITGSCANTDTEYSGYFKAIVTGTEDDPSVDSFTYGDWPYD